jgi:hypothetical protein
VTSPEAQRERWITELSQALVGYLSPLDQRV